jgi:hypothetical protein
MTRDELMLMEMVHELLRVTNVAHFPRNLCLDALVGALIHHLSFMPPQARDTVLHALANFTSVEDVPLGYRLQSQRQEKWH